MSPENPPDQSPGDTASAAGNDWWELVFDPDDLTGGEEPLVEADERSAPAPRPRVLVLGWCLWLLGSWMATMSGELSISAVRRMTVACMIGMLAVWPAIRLSQPPETDLDRTMARTNPRLAIVYGVWVDWLCLFAVFQLVLWSLTIGVAWSAAQALWLDAGIAASSLLAAGVVAWGAMGHSPMRRVLATALCLALILAEPAVMWLIGELAPRAALGDFMKVSPIQTLWALCEPPATWTPWPWGHHVLSTLAGAIVIWTAVVLRAWWAPSAAR